MSKIVDERVILIKRKIQSNAYLMSQAMLAVVILFQQFFYRAPISQYLGELICLLLVNGYVLMANVREGIYRERKEEDTKKERIKMAVAVLAALGTHYFIGGVRNPFRLVVFAITFWVSFVLFRAILTSSSERRQEMLDEELSREELESEEELE